MKDVYEACPVLENERFLVRLLKNEDAEDLFKVYSDVKAVPYFNGDNCHGDTFYMEKIDYVKEAVKWWLVSYENHDFVRFAIVEKKNNEAVGTIELFNRVSDDYFNNCGILRLDLRSDYENKESIYSILQVIIPNSYELFHCTSIATKAKSFAEDRIEALKEYGFEKSKEELVGQDGTKYGDYWTSTK